MHLAWMILIAILSPILADAGTATCAWSPSARATGYKVYYGQASRAYTQVIDVGQATSAVLSGFADGSTWFFAATAYNAGSESDFSQEGSKTFVPSQGDTEPPVVSITSPADGSTVSRRGQVVVMAEASDNVGVRQVEMYVTPPGDTPQLLCTDSLAPFTCAWDVPAANHGRPYLLEAIATDTAGNQTLSPPVSVVAR